MNQRRQIREGEQLGVRVGTVRQKVQQDHPQRRQRGVHRQQKHQKVAQGRRLQDSGFSPGADRSVLEGEQRIHPKNHQKAFAGTFVVMVGLSRERKRGVLLFDKFREKADGVQGAESDKWS